MAHSAIRIEHTVLEAFTSITKSNFPLQSF